MEVEIWKLRDELPEEGEGRPCLSHCATLIEVYKGTLNLKLRNGNYARRVHPRFARRCPPASKADLPSFVKVNSKVEVRNTSEDGDVTYYLALVRVFLGKEELVVQKLVDGTKIIVFRKDCRFPSEMRNLDHYKEVPRLKKFIVDMETICPETSNFDASPDVEEKIEEEKSDQDKPVTDEAAASSNRETQTTISEEDDCQAIEEDQRLQDRLESLAVLMNQYNQKLRLLSSDVECKLLELSSDYRQLEAKMSEVLHGRKECSCSKKYSVWASRNSVTSDDRSISTTHSSCTPNHTPPPTVGFPPSSAPINNIQNSLINPCGFLLHGPFGAGTPGFLPISPFGVHPLARRQIGDKIFNIVSQKYSSDDASKMTEDLLSVLV